MQKISLYKVLKLKDEKENINLIFIFSFLLIPKVYYNIRDL